MRLTFRLLMLAASCGMALLEQAAVADTETFSVIYGGQNVGHLIADTDGSRTQIDFDYKNNGRGPTIAETIVTDELGRPRSWQISGATTFGSKVDERFEWSGATARWTDPAGPGEATIGEPKIYVAEGAVLGPSASTRASCSPIRIERRQRSRAGRCRSRRAKPFNLPARPRARASPPTRCRESTLRRTTCCSTIEAASSHS